MKRLYALLFLLATGAVAQVPTLVRSTSFNYSSAGTNNPTVTIPASAAGNSLVVEVFGTALATGITDNAGNTYATCGASCVGSNAYDFYVAGTFRTASSVTAVTINANNGPSGRILEISSGGVGFAASASSYNPGYVNASSASLSISLTKQSLVFCTGDYLNGTPAVTGSVFTNITPRNMSLETTANVTAAGPIACNVTWDGSAYDKPAIVEFAIESANPGTASGTPTGIDISPHGAALRAGGTQQLTATVHYSDHADDNGAASGLTVGWTSGDTGIITVDASGLVTEVGDCGSGYHGGNSNAADKCVSNVTARLGSTRIADYVGIMPQNTNDTWQLTLSPAIFKDTDGSGNIIPSTFVVGSQVQIGAGYGNNGSLPNGGANPYWSCTWTSSAPGVASVDNHGTVTANSVGSAAIGCNVNGNANYVGGTAISYPLTVIAGGTSNRTFYIRPSGGTRAQCTGLSDTDYAAGGTNACAFGQFQYLYFDGTSHLQHPWAIVGGDTVIVRGKSTGYPIAVIDGPSYNPTNCPDTQNCLVPSIPSGTAARHTRILGENFASCHNDASKTWLTLEGRIGINVSLSQFVDVQCFEITKQSTGGRDNFGVQQSAMTSNVLLKDIFVHGLSNAGLFGASGVGITADYFHIRSVGQTGADFDDYPNGASNYSVSGGYTMTNSITEFSGCTEASSARGIVPIPANSCHDQNTGGSGDGLGTGSTIGTWLFDNDIWRWNYQDGLDLLHSGLQNVTVRNSQSYGNDGQTYKLGAADNVTFTNNVSIGNCNRIDLPFGGVDIAARPNARCRAGGSAMNIELGSTGEFIVTHNTFIEPGWPSILYSCADGWYSNCTTAVTVLKDNAFLGYIGVGTVDADNQHYNAPRQATDFYANSGDPQLPPGTWTTRANNAFYNMRTVLTNASTDIVNTRDFAFINEPSTATPISDSNDASTFDNYNVTLAAGSPLINAASDGTNIGATLVGDDIAPRILEQASSSKKLNAFKGTQYALKVVDGADLETRRTAGQLRLMLSMAGWKEDRSLASLSNSLPVEEGLEVEYNSSMGVLRGMPPENSTDEVGIVLMDVLRQNKISSRRRPRGLSTTMPLLPGHTIIIHVGLKPIGTYFMQKRIDAGAKDQNGNSILGNTQQP